MVPKHALTMPRFACAPSGPLLGVVGGRRPAPSWNPAGGLLSGAAERGAFLRGGARCCACRRLPSRRRQLHRRGGPLHRPLKRPQSMRCREQASQPRPRPLRFLPPTPTWRQMDPGDKTRRAISRNVDVGFACACTASRLAGAIFETSTAVPGRCRPSTSLPLFFPFSRPCRPRPPTHPRVPFLLPLGAMGA